MFYTMRTRIVVENGNKPSQAAGTFSTKLNCRGVHIDPLGILGHTISHKKLQSLIER
jgi:hypothetical protein